MNASESLEDLHVISIERSEEKSY